MREEAPSATWLPGDVARKNGLEFELACWSARLFQGAIAVVVVEATGRVFVVERETTWRGGGDRKIA